MQEELEDDDNGGESEEEERSDGADKDNTKDDKASDSSERPLGDDNGLHDGEHDEVDDDEGFEVVTSSTKSKRRAKKGDGADPNLPGWGGDWVSKETLNAKNDNTASPAKAAKETVTKSQAELDEQDKDVKCIVSCITSDFAMQNVLIQMGLRVLTPDGQRITRVKQWALRCFSCFKITRDMEKLFCPQCGNYTLKRVSISVDSSGSIVAFINAKKKINIRGTKYNMPKNRGGRGPKFITDECELPPKRKSKPKPAATQLGSEFSFGDARNRLPEKPKVGYGTKNPNETRKRTGKKKKKHTQNIK